MVAFEPYEMRRRDYKIKIVLLVVLPGAVLYGSAGAPPKLLVEIKQFISTPVFGTSWYHISGRFR
tara:strand:- start:183 stop:377 length:195 start_codon:yes stop_codon:yes gene_type:complete